MRALQTAANQAYDRLCDLRLGVETAGSDCSPTPYRLVRRAFDALNLAPSDGLIDFGAGRGRIVCYAAQYPIARVEGVEISEPSTAAGQRNVGRLRRRRADRVAMVHGSATEIDCDWANIFYFANPFGERIFQDVLANIRRSLDRMPRAGRFVYFHPTCSHLLDAQEWLAPRQVIHADRGGRPSVLLYHTR